jgi:beta-glucosidase
VEGAVAEDGRGISIWDTFCAIPGRVRGGDSGADACDQYHRYPQDVALMASLGARAYRFSVAWPRIQPEGRGPANTRGLDHYRRLVDELHAAGIEPVLTLYHWDLPQTLEDAGGWPARDTAYRFAEYAAQVHEAIGDRVRYWATLNEPWVAAWLGYDAGVHAPGRTERSAAVAATHHLLLAHGLARDAVAAPVGITLNLEPHRPATADPEDAQLATLADLHMNALFLDPLFGRGYPPALVERFPALASPELVRDGDLETVHGPLAFLGVNYYRPQTIAGSPERKERPLAVPGGLGWSVVPHGSTVTAMGWPIEPGGLTEILVRVHRDYAPTAVFLTENGAAFDDPVAQGGRIDDAPRIAYLRDHVEAAGRALAEGVPLIGYLVWTLLDNFEWAEGYGRRFGLIGVDRHTQARTPKASATWFRALATGIEL